MEVAQPSHMPPSLKTSYAAVKDDQAFQKRRSEVRCECRYMWGAVARCRAGMLQTLRRSLSLTEIPRPHAPAYQGMVLRAGAQAPQARCSRAQWPRDCGSGGTPGEKLCCSDEPAIGASAAVRCQALQA